MTLANRPWGIETDQGDRDYQGDRNYLGKVASLWNRIQFTRFRRNLGLTFSKRAKKLSKNVANAFVVYNKLPFFGILHFLRGIFPPVDDEAII